MISSFRVYVRAVRARAAAVGAVRREIAFFRAKTPPPAPAEPVPAAPAHQEARWWQRLGSAVTRRGAVKPIDTVPAVSEPKSAVMTLVHNTSAGAQRLWVGAGDAVRAATTASTGAARHAVEATTSAGRAVVTSAVKAADVGARARRLRNQVIFWGLVVVFVYAAGTAAGNALPKAILHAVAEAARHREEARGRAPPSPQPEIKAPVVVADMEDVARGARGVADDVVSAVKRLAHRDT